MRKYLINGKEIQGFEGRKIQSTFGEGVELPVEQAKINELLEALSDKEEVKPCRGCELHALENMTGFIPNKCVGDCKPKQEECEHEISSKQVHDNKGTYHIAGNTCLKCGLHELDWGTKPEQEECKKDLSECHSPYCKKHLQESVDKLQPKQSTSLKEALEKILGEKRWYGDTLDYTDKTTSDWANDILDLLQSRLVKEIENECQVYACSRKCGGISPRCILDTDIIKIINNI